MSERRATVVMASVVAAVAVVVFWPAVDAYFVGDDFDFLRNLDGVDRAEEILRSSFWGTYMPTFTASFVLNRALWELDPFGFHLSSYLLHGLASVAAFLLAAALAGGDHRLGLICGLLFAVHPVHDEAVIYIAAQAHVAATGFTLLALALHLAHRTTRRVGFLVASFVATGLALLSKSSALVIPALVLAVDLVVDAPGPAGSLPTRLRRAVVSLLPSLVAVGLYLLLLLQWVRIEGDKVAEAGHAGLVLDRLPLYAAMELLPIPATQVARDVLVAWALPTTVALVAVVVALLAWAWRGGWRDGSVRVPLVALAFMVVTTLPFLLDSIHTKRRYAYFGSFGACLLLAWLFARLLASPSALRRRLAAAALAVLGLGLVASSLQRALLYRASGAISAAVVEDMTRELGDGRVKQVGLLQLPHRVGGDSLVAAYLLHETDFRSLVRFFCGRRPKLQRGVVLSRAEDFSCAVTRRGKRSVDLELRCASERAFATLVEDVAEAEDNDLGRLTVLASDPVERTLSLRQKLERPLAEWRGERRLFYFSDGHLHPLTAP